MFLKNKKRFYLFMHETHTHTRTHTHAHRGRDLGRGRNRLPIKSPMQDSIPDPGSRPEPKADAQPLSHPGVSLWYFKLRELESDFPLIPVLPVGFSIISINGILSSLLSSVPKPWESFSFFFKNFGF